jgi:hypothetical protein
MTGKLKPKKDKRTCSDRGEQTRLASEAGKAVMGTHRSLRMQSSAVRQASNDVQKLICEILCYLNDEMSESVV